MYLPIRLELMLIVSLFRDFISISLLPGGKFGADSISFRLPQHFWINRRIQYPVLYEIYSYLEKEYNIKLTSNSNILPSSLSSEFSTSILFPSSSCKLSIDFLDVFDKVIDRSFSGFKPLIEEYKMKNFIYIDFDVSSVGFFYSAGEKNLGGYILLSFRDYLEKDIDEFFTDSITRMPHETVIHVLKLMTGKIDNVLKLNDVSIKDVERVICGGIYSEVFAGINEQEPKWWEREYGLKKVDIDTNYNLFGQTLLCKT